MRYINRAKQLVFLPLNTGETVHLAPGEVSRRLEPFETDRNEKLARLVDMGIVAEADDVPAAAGTASGKTRSKS